MSRTRHNYRYQGQGYSSSRRLPQAAYSTRVYCKHNSWAVEELESRTVGEEVHTTYRCGDCGKSWIEVTTLPDDSQWHTVIEGSKQDASRSN